MSDTQAQEQASRLLSTTDAEVWAQEFGETAERLYFIEGRTVGNAKKRLDHGWLIGWFANAIETGRNAGRAQGTAGWAEYFGSCQLYEINGRYHDDTQGGRSVPVMAYVVADDQDKAKQGFRDANKDRPDLIISTCVVRSYGNRTLVIV